MNHNPIGWFEIYVQDMARSKTFYETVFQTKLEKIPNPDLDMWMFPGKNDVYGAHGALVKIPGCPSGQNSVIVYFNCDDCAVEEKRVLDNGGKLHKGKFSIGPHGFISLVYDPEGTMIGLHSMK